MTVSRRGSSRSTTHKISAFNHEHPTSSKRADLSCNFKVDNASEIATAERLTGTAHPHHVLGTVLGKPLTKVEFNALQKFRSVPQSDLASYLHRVTIVKPNFLDVVEGSVLEAEQQAMAGLHPAPEDPVKALSGSWQFIYTTAGVVPREQYIPVKEIYDFDLASGKASITTEFGSLFKTIFDGTCSLVDHDSISNAAQFPKVKFDVKSVHVKGGWVDLKLPFKFSNSSVFYWVDENIACTRSSLGLTLMSRVWQWSDFTN